MLLILEIAAAIILAVLVLSFLPYVLIGAGVIAAGAVVLLAFANLPAVNPGVPEA